MAVKQNGIVAKQQAAAAGSPSDLRTLVKEMGPAFKRALPSVMTAERFTRIALTALGSNQQLSRCTRNSFLGALMNSAQLGLEPNTPLGHAYLIPYGNECTFQIGYKGLIALAEREKCIVEAQTVYENDEFECEFGLNPVLRHKPYFKGERGEPILYYAIYHTADDRSAFDVMSRIDAENHGRKYSKTYGNGPWKTNFDEMAKKTVIKKLLKYAPLSSEIAQAVSTDNSIVNASEAAPDDLNIVHVEVPEETESESVSDHAGPPETALEGQEALADVH